MNVEDVDDIETFNSKASDLHIRIKYSIKYVQGNKNKRKKRKRS